MSACLGSMDRFVLLLLEALGWKIALRLCFCFSNVHAKRLLLSVRHFPRVMRLLAGCL